MPLARVNKRVFIFMIGGLTPLIILVLALMFFLIFYPKDNQTGITESNQFEANNLSAGEIKVLRSQEEISVEYKKNLTELLEVVQKMEGNGEENFLKVEAGFFNILVPTNLRDLHVQTLLKIQKLEFEDVLDNKNDLRERLVPLLTFLIEEIE